MATGAWAFSQSGKRRYGAAMRNQAGDGMTAPMPEPGRKPALEECHREAGPILARMFDKVLGVGRWRAPEPGEIDRHE